MEWHDPLRPRLGNGRPALLDAAGRPICALPYICLSPWPNGQHELLALLPRRSNEFEYVMVKMKPEDLPGALAKLLADPEDTFRMWGWNYREDVRAAPAKLQLTLAELGLA